MASPNSYPNPFALIGEDFLTLAGNWFSGSVFWVDSTATAASDANAGTEPELPKLTWTSAYTAAAAGDLILCQPNHVETISVANTLNKNSITTIGIGVGSARPRFTSAVAGAMWTVTGARTNVFNCYFPASTAATTARIANTTGTEFYLFDCYFECGANDTANCVTIAANDAQIEDCVFAATASRPARAVNITGAVVGLFVEGLLLDGGAYGWTNHAFDVTAAATGMLFRDVQLANRSDFYVTSSGTSYQMFGVRPLDNSGCRISLAA